MTGDGSSTSYRFVDRWRVRGTAREVSDILADVTAYPRWWPSTYIDVTEDEPGDQRSIGRTGRVCAQGWLPYRIRFSYRVTESNEPYGFALDSWGDLTGTGLWEIVEDGEWVDVTYTWTVRSDKPLLRYLSFLLKPVFASNHNWTMRNGERSMQLELQRRRARSLDEAADVPAPPGPFPRWVWIVSLGTTAIAAWYGVQRARGSG